MKTLLLSFNGKFMYQLYLVLIYHPIQAYFTLTNPGILNIMVNFDFVFIAIIYPSILAILNYLPTLDGKFCFCLQCHDLPLNMGKKFSLEISWNFDSTHAVLTVKALPDYSGKLLL